MIKIAVIGAGPAGMMAAITAAKAGAKVTVFERNDIAGKKLLLTGNGKCNFTNVDIHADYYSFQEDSFADDILNELTYRDVCDVFMEMGVLSVERKGGLYPFTGQAKTVVNALVRAMERLGVTLLTGSCVNSITKQNNCFTVHTDKENTEFDRVILACGGKAAPKTGSDGFGYRLARGFGHTVSRTYPALVQLIADNPNLKNVAGVRCYANASAWINGEKVVSDYGELQLTEYGLSGIPVFHLSRYLSKAVEEKENCIVKVDFVPQIRSDALEGYVLEQQKVLSGCSFKAFLEGMVHDKLADYFLKIKKQESAFLSSEEDARKLICLLKEMKAWEFVITGHKGFENAQVTKGGVLLDEIDENMQSKLTQGLYFAGEMVDVDAECGGYNLHWAWASGKKAGEEAAK